MPEDVHDFAWTTSPDYVERTGAVRTPGLPPVEMRLLLQPEHAGQADRHFDATRAALRYYGEWFGAVPVRPHHDRRSRLAERRRRHGVPDAVHRRARAGSRRPDVTTPEGVTVHEAGHQFWYGIVGNNEFEHAWMDEGFNTFSTGARSMRSRRSARTTTRCAVLRRLRPVGVPRHPALARDRRQRLAGIPRGGASSTRRRRPRSATGPATGGALSYSKTALWLNTLERYLGWPTLQRVMSTYFDALEVPGIRSRRTSSPSSTRSPAAT